MKKSRIQKLAIACISAFAILGGIGAANAHGGGGGLHGGGGFHDGGGFHGSGFHGHSRGGFFIDAPIFFGPGYYPYGYSYPYGDVPFTFLVIQTPQMLSRRIRVQIIGTAAARLATIRTC